MKPNDQWQEESEILTAKIFYFLSDIQSKWFYFLVKPIFKKWFKKEYENSRGRYLKTYFRQGIKEMIHNHNNS